MLALPERRCLPDERPAVTKTLTVGGFTIYVRVGLYPDSGRPGEIFISTGKVGSSVQGMLNAWAVMVSMALQHGVPLRAIVEKHRDMRFEPADLPAKEGGAPSIVAAVARYLESRFVV